MKVHLKYVNSESGVQKEVLLESPDLTSPESLKDMAETARKLLEDIQDRPAKAAGS